MSDGSSCLAGLSLIPYSAINLFEWYFEVNHSSIACYPIFHQNIRIDGYNRINNVISAKALAKSTKNAHFDANAFPLRLNFALVVDLVH